MRLAFLLDVDNTLLDNDALKDRYDKELRELAGDDATRRFWQLYEEVRGSAGVIDYPKTLAWFLAEHPDLPRRTVERIVMDGPFAKVVYPWAFAVIERMWRAGEPAILSDGDAIYQPRKIARSGIHAAVEGHVLLYVHKEEELDEVERRYPAEHYVLVDDKLRILTAVKEAWGERVTTVFPRQGHYALDPEVLARYPPADISVDRIGDLLTLSLKKFRA
jgi:FMN phosphatase YigB (HAD superfamily)